MNPSRVTVVQVRVDPLSGKPECSPNPVLVEGADALLLFELAPSAHAAAAPARYVFPAERAVVVGSAGDDFPYPCWKLDALRVALYDANNDGLSYHYTVRVHDTQTGQDLWVDPSIENKGR